MYEHTYATYPHTLVVRVPAVVADDVARGAVRIGLPPVVEHEHYVIDALVVGVVMTSRQVALVEGAHVAVDARQVCNQLGTGNCSRQARGGIV